MLLKRVIHRSSVRGREARMQTEDASERGGDPRPAGRAWGSAGGAGVAGESGTLSEPRTSDRAVSSARRARI